MGRIEDRAVAVANPADLSRPPSIGRGAVMVVILGYQIRFSGILIRGDRGPVAVISDDASQLIEPLALRAADRGEPRRIKRFGEVRQGAIQRLAVGHGRSARAIERFVSHAPYDNAGMVPSFPNEFR